MKNSARRENCDSRAWGMSTLISTVFTKFYNIVRSPTQYEREKQLRKGSDQKVLEIEDAFEGERKESTIKVESLTSIVKMFELKSKNSQDHSKCFRMNNIPIITE